MRCCLINKSAVLIILLSINLFIYCHAQTNTLLQGQIINIDRSPLIKEKVLLINVEQKTVADSTYSDSNGVFIFKNIALGNYSIGINMKGVDNSTADMIGINNLNPAKKNQHFKIEEGSLICIENNYSNIKDALENKENIFILNLNSLQFDVAEKSLILGADGTKKLSPKIGEFINLETLSININLISFLPTEIGNLHKLTQLSANLNKLSTLPAEMGNLKNLKALDLRKNSFQLFPECITKYTALEFLDFGGNPIVALPVTINTLKNLKELNLSDCFELTVLPAQIGELINLEILDLSGCGKLKSLPDEIQNLKNLKVLDVTGTKISTKKFQEAVPSCEIRK